MNETVNDKIINRVRKALKRTEEAGCTRAEAEAAFAMASRLLAEHNLGMDDVSVVGGEESESWTQEDAHETGRWSLEDNLCGGILQKFYFVKGILMSGGGRKRYVLFGKPENVATARFVWGALKAAFSKQWSEYRRLTGRPQGERRLFVAGMAQGFKEKLQAERDAQVIERDLAGGTGTALALVGIEKKMVLAFKHAFPKSKTVTRTFSSLNGPQSTLQAGVKVGRSLNLNRGLDSAKRKAIR